MVLLGIQALFGFQLIAVFNQRFSTELSRSEQLVHLIALLLTAVSAALIMTPAAYHRQAERGHVSEYFIAMASHLMTLAMIPLMFGICLDVFLLVRMILGNATAALATGLGLLCLYAGLWFGFPRLHGKSGEKNEGDAKAEIREALSGGG